MGYYVLDTARNGQYFFNLKADNNEVILTSEMYNSKAAAQNGINSCQTNSPFDRNYERKTSQRGEPYFVLKALNYQIIGVSEMYSSVSARENGIASVKRNGPSTRIVDRTLSGVV